MLIRPREGEVLFGLELVKLKRKRREDVLVLPLEWPCSNPTSLIAAFSSAFARVRGGEGITRSIAAFFSLVLQDEKHDALERSASSDRLLRQCCGHGRSDFSTGIVCIPTALKSSRPPTLSGRLPLGLIGTAPPSPPLFSAKLDITGTVTIILQHAPATHLDSLVDPQQGRTRPTPTPAVNVLFFLEI